MCVARGRFHCLSLLDAALAAKGARIVVQDEASSVVWGMPGFVSRAGLADRVLPLEGIGPEIVRYVTSSPRSAISS